MPISFVGSAITNPPGATIGSDVILPSRLTGDLILLQCSINKGTATITVVPQGFTQIAYNASEAAITTVVYQRIATGSDINPHLEWSISGQTIFIAGVYRGVDNATPLIPVGGAIGFHSASSSTAQPAPSITNTDANAWGVYFAAARQVATPLTWTPPTGMIERADADVAVASSANMASTLADTNGVVSTGAKTYSGTTSGATPQATMWATFLKAATAPAGGSISVIQTGIKKTGVSSVIVGGTKKIVTGTYRIVGGVKVSI